MYADTIFPDRYEACGVRLLPLTLGHAMLLDRLGSPLAKPTPVSEADNSLFTFSDALVCAFVCSRPWRVAQRQVDCWRSAMWLRWKFVLRRRHAEEDRFNLLKWHEAMWKIPSVTYESHGSSGKSCGAEWLHHLRVFACQTLNCSPSFAMDQLVATLQYDWICSLEVKGHLRIDEQENDLIIKLAEAFEGGPNGR